MSHTPGPWRAGLLGDHVFVTLPGGKQGVLLDCYAPTNEERAANAHLIAAAPELLAACELWMAITNKGMVRTSDGEWDGAREATEAAIAKATP